MEATLAVVPGEGIGPSIIDATISVLRSAFASTGRTLSLVHAPSTFARDEYGLTLDAPTRAFYNETFEAGLPILHGPAGGRFVYELRREYELAVKHTPIKPLPEIADASVVRPERLIGTDIMIVRDNASGLYQGNFGWRDERSVAFQEASYDRASVEVVIGEAIRVASERRGHLTVVTKPGGVPTISALWKTVATELASNRVDLRFLEIDNASFQLVTSPTSFDVMVAPNMFGDVLGDTAAVLLGSRGMSYSANFSSDGRAVYQTAHGAAHDLAGRDVANPLGQILSAAWLLRHSLSLNAEADTIEAAVAKALAAGWRTADVASESSRILGTSDFAAKLVEAISESV
jgi:3-isopropylmalate dehydrogenase